MIKLTHWGFSIWKPALIQTVADIVKYGVRDIPFKNGKPDKKCCQIFLRRLPDVSLREAESINKARATVTEMAPDEQGNFVLETGS